MVLYSAKLHYPTKCLDLQSLPKYCFIPFPPPAMDLSWSYAYSLLSNGEGKPFLLNIHNTIHFIYISFSKFQCPSTNMTSGLIKLERDDDHT